jgi:5'-3' exonuclease
MSNKILTLDISNMIMRCLFAQTPGPEEKEFLLFKATFFSSFFKAISEINPNRVFCCIDGTSWRKDIYEGYKASRAAKRSASIVNFDKFFEVWGNLLERMKKAFEGTNIYFVDVPRTEADDQIAVITKYHPQWECYNVSSDRDFMQLFVYPNYHQFDAIKKEYLGTLNPETDLLVKIITGDKSDDIPGIKRGTGVKTAEKIVNSGELDKWLDENNLNEQFLLNSKLISFENIPTEYVEAINRVVDSFEYNPEPRAKKFNEFSNNSGIGLLVTNIIEYTNIIKSIK